MPKTLRLTIKRQASQEAESYWESFDLNYQYNSNVISALMELRKNPVNTDGDEKEPPVWEAACLEEVCGTCTMIVNGQIRQSCTALVDDVATDIGDDIVEIRLEPMTKFPVVRDLIVDRSSMFETLIKIHGWVPIDGSFDLGMASPQDDAVRQLRYALSRCMTCGCCLEACPQVNEKSAFSGPAAVGQSLLFNLHPVGQTLENERLDYMTSEEGVTNCGNAQNCVKVCPKGVPLTDAIAQMNRDTTAYKFRKWFGLSGNK